MATPIALQNLLTLSSPQYSTRMTGGDYANTAAATALASGANSYNIRRLNEQLAIAKKEYENLVKQQGIQNEQWEKGFANTQSQQGYANKVALINSGMLSESERNVLLDELLGNNMTGGTGRQSFVSGGGMGSGGSRRPSGTGTDTSVTDITGLLDEAIRAEKEGSLQSYYNAGAPSAYTALADDYRRKIKKLLGS